MTWVVGAALVLLAALGAPLFFAVDCAAKRCFPSRG
jgi:hypothetical protein